jgi:sugar O-acyltransferase (sialic acid O-acetyltransferase NeuD family)
MIIYGASGHGKVVASAAISQGKEVVAFFDDGFEGELFFGKKQLGAYDELKLPEKELVIAIGSNSIRKVVSEKVKHSYVSIIDINSTVHESAKIGEGTVVMMGASVQIDVQLGNHVIVNTAASVDHDCEIGDYVHLSPNATLCGAVKVGKLTQIGANATVLPNLTIGENCTIGAGAVVTKDIPDKTIVIGNPARKIGENE